MIVQFRNEKVSNHSSIPITIDCNFVAFIGFEEEFHQPIKRTKQSVFMDVTVFRHTLVNVGVPSWKYPNELGFAHSVISRLWQRFQDDSNMSRHYNTDHPRGTTMNEDQYLVVTAKNTDGAQHQTCLVSPLPPLVRQFKGRPFWKIRLYARRLVKCVPLTAVSLE
ncbi:uncharacterized protein TNCV_2382371 [Trichonephila clavipes]|nr:uncharacterized protein TNCV_2382371 [Trichonephila clavipes]